MDSCLIITLKSLQGFNFVKQDIGSTNFGSMLVKMNQKVAKKRKFHIVHFSLFFLKFMKLLSNWAIIVHLFQAIFFHPCSPPPIDYYFVHVCKKLTLKYFFIQHDMDFNIHPQNPKKITQKFMKEKHIIDMV